MDDYRTERDALRGRVENLEQDLGEAREALAARQGSDQTERVALLEKQLHETQATLDHLSRELATLKGVTRARPRAIRMVAFLAAGFCAATGVVTVISRSRTPPPPPVYEVPTPPPSVVVPPPTPSPPPAPAPLELEITIGGKGDGPGLFQDPREVAPEADGGFFVADYDSGRVQRFDAAGKYRSTIAVEPGKDGSFILDMAASGDGKLYVVRAGELLRFSAADGKKLGAVPPPKPGATYRHVFVDAAGDLYALSVEKDDKLGALSKLDKDGKLLGRWPRKAAEHEYYLAHDRVAANAGGTMFVAHHYGYFVEVIDPKGALQNRIGQEGRGPGELERLGMGSIDVDGRGHVLVANNGRISVFDAGGRFRGDLRFEEGPGSAGYVRAFRVGADGRLYAATNQDKAVVYRLDPNAIEALGR